MILENVIPKNEAIVGPKHVLTAPEDCWTYAYDATGQAHAPEAVVLPGSVRPNLVKIDFFPETYAIIVPMSRGAPIRGSLEV